MTAATGDIFVREALPVQRRPRTASHHLIREVLAVRGADPALCQAIAERAGRPCILGPSCRHQAQALATISHLASAAILRAKRSCERSDPASVAILRLLIGKLRYSPERRAEMFSWIVDCLRRRGISHVGLCKEGPQSWRAAGLSGTLVCNCLG